MSARPDDAVAPRPRDHDPIARGLHWTMAAMLAVQASLGLAGERVADRGLSAWLMGLHVQAGVALFALLALRLAWRLARPPRPAPWPARAVHGLLYALMAALPLSGYLLYPWEPVATLAGTGVALPAPFTPVSPDDARRVLAWYVHVYGAWAMGGLVLGHAGAALWHRMRGRGAYWAPRPRCPRP